MKTLNILSLVCAVVGVPWAVLHLLAGAMKSIPRFNAQELASSLPLLVAAALFGGASIFISRTATPREETSKWVVGAVVVSVLIAGAAVITYFDTA